MTAIATQSAGWIRIIFSPQALNPSIWRRCIGLANGGHQQSLFFLDPGI